MVLLQLTKLQYSIEKFAKICCISAGDIVIKVTLTKGEWDMRKVMLMITLLILLCGVMTSCHSQQENKEQAKEKLFEAIESNDIDTVENIIQQFPALVNENQYDTGFWETATGATDSTPLLKAIQYGNQEIVSLLLTNGADANKKAINCYPLIEAIRRGHNEIAWLLIEHGADVSVVDSTPWRQTVPYQIVSIKVAVGDTEHAEEQLALLKYVIEKGAPLTPPVGRPKGINTLLGVAASQNQGSIVKYLLEQKLYGVDDRVTDDNKTALICAVEERAYDACEALLKCNADKTLKDAHGKTAMDYALELNDEKLISILNK
jgi:ankyrin repeat protein